MVDKKSPCLSEDTISTALRTTFAICLSTVSSSFALNLKLKRRASMVLNPASTLNNSLSI